MIFPEGFLRRKEEQPLRRFGQGAWAILQARPDTPVFATWIEGGVGELHVVPQRPADEEQEERFPPADRRGHVVGDYCPAGVARIAFENAHVLDEPRQRSCGSICNWNRCRRSRCRRRRKKKAAKRIEI